MDYKYILLIKTKVNNNQSKEKENLLSYYLANKRSLYVRFQGLEIPTLIEKNRKIKINSYVNRKK